MEIRNDAAGKPSVALGGGAREICERLGIGDMLISISHCRTHATALADRRRPRERDASRRDVDHGGFLGTAVFRGGLLGGGFCRSWARPSSCRRSRFVPPRPGPLGQQRDRLLERQVFRRRSLGERRVGGSIGHVRSVATVEQLDRLTGHRRFGELTQRLLRGGPPASTRLGLRQQSQRTFPG